MAVANGLKYSLVRVLSLNNPFRNQVEKNVALRNIIAGKYFVLGAYLWHDAASFQLDAAICRSAVSRRLVPDGEWASL